MASTDPEHQLAESSTDPAAAAVATGEEDIGAQIAPTIQLTEVAVITGEEDEDALLDVKAKLYRDGEALEAQGEREGAVGHAPVVPSIKLQEPAEPLGGVDHHPLLIGLKPVHPSYPTAGVDRRPLLITLSLIRSPMLMKISGREVRTPRVERQPRRRRLGRDCGCSEGRSLSIIHRFRGGMRRTCIFAKLIPSRRNTCLWSICMAVLLLMSL